MDCKIELVHLQLTKNCNLRCWFCGQWGKKGFFSDDCGTAMEYEDWTAVAKQLIKYRDTTGISPGIMLWGGEPLTCAYFEKIVRYLRECGFELGIVTNGTLIDRYSDLLKNEFRHIYVSVDGTREAHDKIRGVGVYDKVAANLELLRQTDAKITLMSVVNEGNINILDEMSSQLLGLGCDELRFQDMIALTEREAEDYRAVMKEKLDIDAVHINSWIMTAPDFDSKKIFDELCKKYDGRVKYVSHSGGKACSAPWSHIHIAWNGNLLYCTDFYDFSAGNVKDTPIVELIENERSQIFRQIVKDNRCATCNHCSWRKSEEFGI